MFRPRPIEWTAHLMRSEKLSVPEDASLETAKILRLVSAIGESILWISGVAAIGGNTIHAIAEVTQAEDFVDITSTVGDAALKEGFLYVFFIGAAMEVGELYHQAQARIKELKTE